uniref:Uncharacterized protein n=1 Tax=Oryza sativa subsp. japonica TaxID=39947 RepID=Q9AYA1_ORYSJ|nr:hypothetical protein [Oryza sativa Japonica Group]
MVGRVETASIPPIGFYVYDRSLSRCYTSESSPPHQSNSGKDIQYALGLIPNGGGPSPPVIGYNAPKTSTLLQGLIREPADAGKKRRTRSSAADTLALAPKKKAKLKKPKPTDDLPVLDPSIEQALDEEDIEDDVDQAAAELVHEEKSKLDQLSEGPIKSNIDRLEARKIELLAQLEECNAELDIEHKKLTDLPKSVEEQKARLRSAIKNVVDMTKSLKVIFGTDAQDAQAIEEVEQIRQRAILAIQRYLSP